MIDEPSRIGLSKEANAYLDEMLESLNSEVKESKGDLIKFDLYRLAVAIGVKKGEKLTAITEKMDSSFRVGELDVDQALYIAVKAAKLNDPDEPIYHAVERLADHGIRSFYSAYQKNMGKLPWGELLS
ncbi:hypothetical protein N9284_02035 [Halieaceae bacterium]|nr:hypothetical protein [Halieaceae bacterium]